MSEHIVHTAVYEDCMNLINISEEICEEFKVAVLKYKDFGQLGSITVSGDRFTFKLLKEYKEKWNTRTPEDRIDLKLAFVLGWISHRAADRQMKPIWRLGHIKQISSQQSLKPTECSIYQEAHIFREYYIHDEIFASSIMQQNQCQLSSSIGIKNHDAFVTLARSVLKRCLIETHTLKPNCEDINGWIDRLYDIQQNFYVDINRYSNAVLNPDPQKYKMYIVDVNFFDSNDPVIILCKKIRNGAPVDTAQITASIGSKNSSHYAKAVALGYNYIKAANDYFKGFIDFETLKDRLDIDKKGPAGVTV